MLCKLSWFPIVLGGDLRLHDRHNRSPRDWAMLQPNENLRTQTCSLIESFRQATMRTTDCSYHELGFAELNSNSPHRSRQTLRLPAKFRNTLAALGLVYNEDYEYIGPLGTMQGTGFGKVLTQYLESILSVITFVVLTDCLWERRNGCSPVACPACRRSGHLRPG